MDKLPVRCALRTALTLTIPLLLGAMHCPAHCPTLGPEYVSRLFVGQQQPRQSGLRRVTGKYSFPVTVLRQELRVTELRGEVVATSCTPEADPWSRPVESGVLAFPPTVDCLIFTSDKPDFRVDGSLHMFAKEQYGGGRGRGVHGQDCMHGAMLNTTWVRFESRPPEQ